MNERNSKDWLHIVFWMEDKEGRITAGAGWAWRKEFEATDDNTTFTLSDVELTIAHPEIFSADELEHLHELQCLKRDVTEIDGNPV